MAPSTPLYVASDCAWLLVVRGFWLCVASDQLRASSNLLFPRTVMYSVVHSSPQPGFGASKGRSPAHPREHHPPVLAATLVIVTAISVALGVTLTRRIAALPDRLARPALPGGRATRAKGRRGSVRASSRPTPRRREPAPGRACSAEFLSLGNVFRVKSLGTRTARSSGATRRSSSARSSRTTTGSRRQ